MLSLHPMTFRAPLEAAFQVQGQDSRAGHRGSGQDPGVGLWGRPRGLPAGHRAATGAVWAQESLPHSGDPGQGRGCGHGGGLGVMASWPHGPSGAGAAAGGEGCPCSLGLLPSAEAQDIAGRLTGSRGFPFSPLQASGPMTTSG